MGNLFYTKKVSINSRLKAIQMIGQRKHSIGREFQSLAMRGKKLLTQISLKHIGIQEWLQKSHTTYQNKIYESYSTYRRGLSWPHFSYEPRIQQRQQRKNQQSYISVFVVFVAILSNSQQYPSRHDDSIPCKAVWQIYRDKGQSQKKET